MTNILAATKEAATILIAAPMTAHMPRLVPGDGDGYLAGLWQEAERDIPPTPSRTHTVDADERVRFSYD